MSRTPNFFIIGVAKAGSTSLDSYLDQHPDIFMCPRKEPRFFAVAGKEDTSVPGPMGKRLMLDGVTDLVTYEALFAQAQDEKMVGENSNRYMEESEIVAERIQQYNPEARLLAILRDPVDRSYSHFQMNVRSRVENGNAVFTPSGVRPDALVKRLSDPFYVNMGQYHAQLQPYFKIFNQDELKVICLRDLISDRDKALRDIFQFLGVDDTFTLPATKVHNAGGIPRSTTIQQFIKGVGVAGSLKELVRSVVPGRLYKWIKWKIYHNNQVTAPPLPASVRARLIPLYKDDIERLKTSIDMDIEEWMQAQPESNVYGSVRN